MVSPLVLQGLDDWYLARIETRYDTDLEQSIDTYISNLGSELRERIAPTGALHRLQRDSVIADAREFFSTGYPNMKRIQLIGPLAKPDFAPGVYNEYIQPLIGCSYQFTNFVELVDETHNSDNPFLRDDLIRASFKYVFNDAEGFLAFGDTLTRQTLIAADASDAYLTNPHEVYQAVRPAMSLLIHSCFGDI